MCTQKITFWLNLPRKVDEYCIFCALLKSTLLTQKISLNSRFLLKILHRVRFWIEIFKTCIILKQKFLQHVRFWIKFLKRVRCCEKIIYLKSRLSPPHINFTTLSSIKPCTITAYIIFVNQIIAFATVQTLLLVPIFARVLKFVLSHIFLWINPMHAETSCYQFD